jgi:ribosomal protein S18 acetylase RimI-like enzyme
LKKQVPGTGETTIIRATAKDAEEILKLQKLAFKGVGEMYNDFTIPPLTQTLEEIRAQYETHVILKATVGGVIIGSVRGYLEKDTCYIGRLIVHPDFENRGAGSRLMKALETEFKQAKRYELFTGHRNERNLHLYHKLGYKTFKSEPENDNLTIVYLEKINSLPTA